MSASSVYNVGIEHQIEATRLFVVAPPHVRHDREQQNATPKGITCIYYLPSTSSTSFNAAFEAILISHWSR